MRMCDNSETIMHDDGVSFLESRRKRSALAKEEISSKKMTHINCVNHRVLEKHPGRERHTETH